MGTSQSVSMGTIRMRSRNSTLTPHSKLETIPATSWMMNSVKSFAIETSQDEIADEKTRRANGDLR